MQQITRIGLFLVTFGIGACVTINIYFPAAAAEKVADRIIQDVWGDQPSPGTVTPPAPAPDRGSLFFGTTPSVRVATARLLAMLIPVAEAAEPDLTVSTPAIVKLTAAMKTRHAKLEPFYKSGAVGLTSSALVAVRDAQGIPLNQRNTVTQLVTEENNDRAALYREIAKANEHPEWETNIRDTFGRRWIANAATGWWYQDSSGAWKQK
ncbi:MAG: YdbL family protein [Deltaproteobacteria bacterium]|nr:YdbL family protein [Deltaproteobacteria bacterium]